LKPLKQRASPVSPVIASRPRHRQSLPARNTPHNITTSVNSSPFVTGPIHVIQPKDLIPIQPHSTPITSPRTSNRLSTIDTLLKDLGASDDEPVNWEELELKRGRHASHSDSEVEFVNGPVLKKCKRFESHSYASSSRSYMSSSHTSRIPSLVLSSDPSDDEVEFIEVI
jgi:hypothetical protein